LDDAGIGRSVPKSRPERNPGAGGAARAGAEKPPKVAD
jgi:hypothetical protein